MDQFGGEKVDSLGWSDGFFGVFVGRLERSLRTPFGRPRRSGRRPTKTGASGRWLSWKSAGSSFCFA